MTTYGPWIQAPDYQRDTATVTPGARWTKLSAGVDYPPGSYDDAGNFPVEKVNQELAVVNIPDALTTAGGHPFGASMYTGLDSYVASGVNARAFSTVAGHDETSGHVTASELLDLAFFQATLQAPPNAVGIQFTGNQSAPVGAIFAATITEDGTDGTNSADENATTALPINATFAVRSATSTTDMSQDPVEFASILMTGPTGITHHVSVDVTPWLTGSSGQFTITPSARVGGPWGPVEPRYSLLTGSTWKLSRSFTVSALTTYTLRPPQYRWVFEAVPPGVAPLRQFPRDDGLATSSARRQLGSQSWQGSNRRIGYW